MVLRADLEWLMADTRRYKFSPLVHVEHPCAMVITYRHVRKRNEGRNFTLRCACMSQEPNIGRPFNWDRLDYVRDLDEAREVWSAHTRAKADGYTSNATTNDLPFLKRS